MNQKQGYRETEKGRGMTRRTVLGGGIAVGTVAVAGCLSSDGEDGKAGFRDPDEDVDAEVVIYWFWGDGCPVCADQRPFMEELSDRDGVEVVALETYDDPDNRVRYQEFSDAYGIEREAVPLTFVGDDYWFGYSEAIEAEIETAVNSCLETGCPHPEDAV